MTATREGGCSCGAVRYRLESEPLFVHCCHCLNCQRQTGSAFVINLLIEADRVELLAGEPQRVDLPRERGKQKVWRCPTCEIALYSQYTSPLVRFIRGAEVTPVLIGQFDLHFGDRLSPRGKLAIEPRLRVLQ